MNALAFVVGNAEYDRPDLHLANVKNDAIAISRNLFGLGFTVDLLLNCNLSTFASRLATFGENLKKYDVGLFYFAVMA